jgi:hypothetical protein
MVESFVNQRGGHDRSEAVFNMNQTSLGATHQVWPRHNNCRLKDSLQTSTLVFIDPVPDGKCAQSLVKDVTCWDVRRASALSK